MFCILKSEKGRYNVSLVGILLYSMWKFVIVMSFADESGLDVCVRQSCLECCGIKKLSLKCMSWELTEENIFHTLKQCMLQLPLLIFFPINTLETSL